jgi:hypothetical protein
VAAVDRWGGHRATVTQQETRIGERRTSNCQAETKEHG